MKTTPHLLLTAALALGSSLAFAQDDTKPQPPPAPDAGARPPEATPPAPRPQDRPARPPEGAPGQPPRPPEGGRPNQPRGPERERMREGDDRRDGHDGRPGDRHRPEDARGDKDRGNNDRGGNERGRDHRDGSGKPDDRQRGPDMGRRAPAMPPVPLKATSYLGVMTMPPPAAINAQFSLPPGFGLIVTDVLPDSPAAAAGLQQYDVLTKFNDQQLVDGGQFSTLVRAQTKDGDATLTLFRKAQEQKVAVKIGEKMMPERRAFSEMGARPHGVEPGHRPGGDAMKNMEQRMKEHGEKMREFQERMKSGQPKPSAQVPQSDGDALRLNSGDVLREVQPGGLPLVTLLQPDATVTYRTQDAKLLMKDDSGEIEVVSKDGQRQLVAKNPQGETVFAGPIDSEAQRAALSEELREKIELINAQSRMVRFDAPVFAPTEEAEIQ